MADNGVTVTEEQLALFKDHVELQRAELAEQREKNRADEAIEMRRIKAEVDMHSSNLAHAGRVLDAQAGDRQQIRTFWNAQLGRFCWLIIGIMFISATICTIAIVRGETEVVFRSIETIATHAFALMAGVGADRLWIHRKKAGLSAPVDEK